MSDRLANILCLCIERLTKKRQNVVKYFIFHFHMQYGQMSKQSDTDGPAKSSNYSTIETGYYSPFIHFLC